MGIRNAKLGGSDFNSGESPVASADVNDTFDAALLQHIASDQTGGSKANQGEAEIGEVEIPANKIGTGVLVIATGKVRSSSGNTGTIKLYGGTNATAIGNNTIFKTITRDPADGKESGWTLTFWIDSLTWSSLNYINITGNNSEASGSAVVTCESIVVFGK